MATVRQITKQLKEANIDLNGVTVNRDEVEVYVKTVKGEYSEKLTDAKMRKINKVLHWGGFRCGYGAWVLQADYQDPGNWNDKSSRHHY